MKEKNEIFYDCLGIGLIHLFFFFLLSLPHPLKKNESAEIIFRFTYQFVSYSHFRFAHTHIPTSQLNHLHWLKYLRAVGGWYISSRFVFVFVLLAWFAPSPHKKLWRASCWKNKRKKKMLPWHFLYSHQQKQKQKRSNLMKKKNTDLFWHCGLCCL